MKILIADDEPVSRRLIERTLERYGYEVITAGDGAAAIRELIKPDGPRLALIDWMMPELDGPEVCRQLRARQGSPYVYMLLLTSKELSEDIVTGLEAGADDYLTKPCEPAELQARLRTGQRILKLEDNLVEAREQMRFKATHDALTALWDRGAILALLRGEVNRSAADFPVGQGRDSFAPAWRDEQNCRGLPYFATHVRRRPLQRDQRCSRPPGGR